ncbi:MAG: DMT family transporter [Proteobacteria bacterium]|nr:DMT family transporter [Pseudomonadota bacterium]
MTAAKHPNPRSQPLFGMACGVLAFMCYSVQDALVSLMAKVYPAAQVTWVDCALALALLLGAVALRKGVKGVRTVFHTRHLWAHLLRGTFFAVGAVMAFTALPHVPLPNMYVIIFLSPLLGASLSGIFLKEPVGVLNFAALLIGFAGVFVAMRPGAEGFNMYALLILGAACLFSVNALLNRFLAQRDHAVVMIYYPMAVAVGLLVFPVLQGWKPIASQDIWYFAAMGMALAVAFFLNANAFKRAPIYLVAPTQFLQFFWGTLAQFLLYKTWPTHHAIIGAVLIILSNLLILYLQYRAQRKEAPP